MTGEVLSQDLPNCETLGLKLIKQLLVVRRNTHDLPVVDGDPLLRIACQQLRPDRVEPRPVKRHPKPYPLRTQPRRAARNALRQHPVDA